MKFISYPLILKVNILFIQIIFSNLIGQSSEFIRGVDISILDQIEDNNGQYFENGIQKDALDIFKNHGVNTIRLKLWHTPESNYNSIENVLLLAERIDSAGFDFMLDIHYSDTWADPGHQTKPSAWDALDFPILCDSVYTYTNQMVSQFKSQNTVPKFIQIGNETDCGFLWPDGNVCDENNTEAQWEKLGLLFHHALDGISDAIDESDTVFTIVHTSQAHPWFLSNLFEENVSIDIIGRSYYPWWHGTFEDLSNNLSLLETEFQKPIILLETAYPFTLSWNDNTNNIVGIESQLLEGYPATEIGQLDFLLDVKEIIENSEMGAGICYWSPEWISTDSFESPWENLALFDFNGEMLQGMTVFEEETVSIKNPPTPYDFELFQNYPNPFNPFTTIQFSLENPQFISLQIINIKGSVVERIFHQHIESRHQKAFWDASNHSSGIYFAELISGNNRQIKKMILLK